MMNEPDGTAVSETKQNPQTPTKSNLRPLLDVEAVRRDFPILGKQLPNGQPLVYLDNAASAQKPQRVIDKQTEVCENYYANAYRGDYQLGAHIDIALEAVRSKIQEFIGAQQPDEIIFTSGTTMSINLVANAWGRKFLAPGDEILVNPMEHHANLVPWQQIAAEKQAGLRYIPLTEDGRLDLESLDDVLTEKTKLVAVTAMSNVLGTINPIDLIVEKAKSAGALVLVDAAQSVPHSAVDVCNPQIDFLAFSGHKLYGPTGIGVLYGRRELLETMDPFLCGGHMIDRVFLDHSTWAELPAKFEAGTLPIVQAIALGTAVDYVMELGFDAIHEHEQHLLQKAHEVLQNVPGLVIYGPSPDQKGSIVSFTVEGAHPQDLSFQLDRKGVAVRYGHHCTMPLHDWLDAPATVRASFAFYNTTAEIDALVDALYFARKKLRLK
jgi:cysteine desulfurase/selenocysteine lyase